MKRFFTFLLLIFVITNYVDYKYLNYDVQNYVLSLINNYKIETNLDVLNENEYKIKNYVTFVNETDNFVPESKQDLLNIYYTVLNNGFDDFSFYCSVNYKNCLSDMEALVKDKTTFSNINQIIHPFNSFDTIETNYSSDGRVDIKVNKKYSDDDITMINNKMNEIVNKLNINSYNNVNDKIKVFHDYLANTNKYDSDRENNNTSNYHSDTAVGTLFEGMSVCSGYSDALSIFLNMLNIDNLKISTTDHVWNIVYINNKWYHIDLTWDDPILSNGKDTIIYDYFMITTDELKEKNDDSHNYDEGIYSFIK